jgi:hypothetical protein
VSEEDKGHIPDPELVVERYSWLTGSV